MISLKAESFFILFGFFCFEKVVQDLRTFQGSQKCHEGIFAHAERVPEGRGVGCAE